MNPNVMNLNPPWKIKIINPTALTWKTKYNESRKPKIINPAALRWKMHVMNPKCTTGKSNNHKPKSAVAEKKKY